MDSWLRRPVPAAALPVPAKTYPHLADGLMGISDRVIADHLRLYDRYCVELGQLDGARARAAWTSAAGIASADMMRLFDARVASLPLVIEGRLLAVLEQLRGELVAKGISWFPSFYLGEADFWTTDQGISINVPWYLANDTLWTLINDQELRMTDADVLAILRHETGHAIGYAFELWRTPEWQRAFGDFFAEYADTFAIDPTSTDFVQHLHGMVSAPNAHYAQKHADEDWAETFATWLDPGSRWREEYASWPGALAKLEAVELLVTGKGSAYGPPPNTRPGRRVPYTMLDYTVAEFLGQGVPGAPDATAAAIAKTPDTYGAIVLHEIYFAGLVRGGRWTDPPALAAEICRSFGSVEGWAGDLRAMAAGCSGWVVTARDARAGGSLRNFQVRGHSDGLPAGAPIIFALDLHEHAYAGDVGIRKDVYVAAWFANLDLVAADARLRAAAPPLPQPWGVLYAPPNADGSRKRCGNCYLLGGGTACTIHDSPVTPDMVCGYHLFGAPADERIHLPVAPISPGLSGLTMAPPGGTACGICRFYQGPPVGPGLCFALGGLGSEPPAPVDAAGCCGRWEPAPVVGSVL